MQLLKQRSIASFYQNSTFSPIEGKLPNYPLYIIRILVLDTDIDMHTLISILSKREKCEAPAQETRPEHSNALLFAISM